MTVTLGAPQGNLRRVKRGLKCCWVFSEQVSMAGGGGTPRSSSEETGLWPVPGSWSPRGALGGVGRAAAWGQIEQGGALWTEPQWSADRLATVMGLAGGISVTGLPGHSDRTLVFSEVTLLQADPGSPWESPEDVSLGEIPTYQKVLAWSGIFQTDF